MTPLEEWARCKPWIEGALKRTGFYNIEDVEREIEQGSMTFWPGRHGAAVTEFINYPNGRALNVFAGGGERGKSLREFIEVFEPCFLTWANLANCRWIIGYGRKGWEPICKRMGYRTIWTVMMKEL